MAKLGRVLPVFYNRAELACSDLGLEIEVVSRALDADGDVLPQLRDNWDGCDRLPSRGPQWRAIAVDLADGSMCLIMAREHPHLADVVQIRDLVLIPDPNR